MWAHACTSYIQEDAGSTPLTAMKRTRILAGVGVGALAMTALGLPAVADAADSGLTVSATANVGQEVVEELNTGDEFVVDIVAELDWQAISEEIGKDSSLSATAFDASSDISDAFVVSESWVDVDYGGLGDPPLKIDGVAGWIFTEPDAGPLSVTATGTVPESASGTLLGFDVTLLVEGCEADGGDGCETSAMSTRVEVPIAEAPIDDIDKGPADENEEPEDNAADDIGDVDEEEEPEQEEESGDPSDPEVEGEQELEDTGLPLAGLLLGAGALAATGTLIRRRN